MSRRLAACASLVVASVGLPAASSGVASDGVIERWRIPVISPPDRATQETRAVQTIIDRTRMRAYQVMALKSFDGNGARDALLTEITVFDLRDGRRIAVRRLPFSVELTAGGPSYLYSEARGWLVLETREIPAGGPTGQYGNGVRVPGEHRVLGVDALEAGQPAEIAQPQLPFEFAGRSVGASEFVETADGPKIRTSMGPTYGVRPVLPKLIQLDIQTGALDWQIELTPCVDVNRRGLVMTAADGERVYVECVRSGGLESVVPVPLRADGALDETSPLTGFGAERHLRGSAGDPVSERIAFIGEQEVTVFDGIADRMIGRAAIPGGGVNSFGVDAGYGRLFILNPNTVFAEAGQVQASGRVDRGGLQSMDLRTTPPGQFVNLDPQLGFPSLTRMQILPAGSGQSPIISLRRAAGEEDYNEERFAGADNTDYRYPDGKQIFVRDEPFYRVLEDRTPETALPTFADVDRLTSGIPEAGERTSVTADANTSAYGLRLTLSGGPTAPLRHVENWDGAEQIIRDRGGLPGCWTTDRELIGGLIERTQVTDAGATAAASGDFIDPRTIGDAETPGDRCRPTVAAEAPPIEGGVDISTSLVECVDTGGSAAEGRTPGATATIACDAAHRTASAQASHSLGTLGPVRVGSSGTSTLVEPDPEQGGLHATSLAWVHGIDLAGVVRIDLAVSRASVWSNGRPADDRATMERTICGIHPTSGSPVLGCIPAAEAAPILNQALAGRGRVRVPAADPLLLTGSPGGYVAGVTKPLAEDLEDQLVRRDFRKEVAAFEFASFSDSLFFGHAEERFQFAGVRAVVAYGVNCAVPFVLDAKAGRCLDPVIAPDPTPDPPITEPEPVVRPTVPPPPTTTVPPPPNSTFAPPPTVATAVTELLVRSISEGFSGALVWLLIGLPLTVASRRWAHDAGVRR